MAERIAYNKAGIGNVGSYQVAGHPYITGSTVPSGGEVLIQFPLVAKSVTIISLGTPDLRVHFRSKDEPNVISGHHYITLFDIKDNVTFHNKCKEIYISAPSGSGEFEMFAELTHIDAEEMYLMTGSGITE
jgi:hypothetical protein